MLHIFLKRASIFGALFFWADLTTANSDLPTSCEPKTNIARYTVSRIFDGDTIHLSNGWKVRVIGINTPETAHDNKPAQPFADDAKTLLENLIQRSNSIIGFIPGKQEKDHYGRRLGHIFTSDEENLSARLLEKGLGFRLSISPNLNLLQTDGGKGTPSWRRTMGHQQFIDY
ncbi:MAG: hypothetical protein EP297_08455 [Gammaproteobacteria bacterium]|nr:MAG: hypothetical protein EP297_08455 [Gammaproteobacteria bacterium]